MRLDPRLSRHIPVQQLTIPGIAVDVVPRPGSLVVDRTAAPPAVTGALDGFPNPGGVRRPEVRLDGFQAIPRGIRLHWKELPELASAVRNSACIPRA